MKPYLLVLLLLTAAAPAVISQNRTMGIGTGSPNPNAVLHVESPGNNQGFIMPRLTTGQRTAPDFISSLGAADNGLMVYDVDVRTIFFWNGTAWKSTQEVAEANLAYLAAALVLPYADTTGGVPDGSDLLRIVNEGSSPADVGVARFLNTNPQNIAPALTSETNGTGPAVSSINSGTGPAAQLEIDNVSSSAAVLMVTTNGTGNAVETDGKIVAGQFQGDGSLLTGIVPGANSISAAEIVDNTITDQDINIAAGIAGSKIEPDFANKNIQTTGTVTASAFFGDGSALTGLPGLTLPYSSSDPGSVSLSITNTSTSSGTAASFTNSETNNNGPAVSVSSNGLSYGLYSVVTNPANNSYAIFGETQGSGVGGGFRINNSANSQAALSSYTDGLGQAAVFQVLNPGNTNDAIQIFHNGTGNAIMANRPIRGTDLIATGNVNVNGLNYSWPGVQGSGVLTNNGTGSLSWTPSAGLALPYAGSTSSGSTAFDITNSGSAGYAGSFSNTNSSNTSSALFVSTAGNANAIRALSTGGPAAYLQILNSSSPYDALFVTTDGTGPSGNFNITNAASSASAVNINHAGTGNAITANRPIQASAFIGDGSGLTNLPTTGWGLAGTAGTSDGLNFIGTTDDVPFNVRVNNQKAARIDNTLQNAFYGYQAGNANTTGNFNTAIGHQSFFTNTTGFGNTALGYASLYNGSTAIYNCAIGYGALQSNTGNQNTAVGALSLNTNTTGAENTSTGYYSLRFNTVGNANVANGSQSLYSNTSGTSNSALGNGSLRNNATGSNNTAIGYSSLYEAVAGSNATAVGYGAMLFANNTATPYTNSNVAVGYQALRGSTTASANTGNDNTAIGYEVLLNNSSGNYNTATGGNALYPNTTGNANTANGFQALYSNSTGDNNTAVGYQALMANTTGFNNTAIGLQAFSTGASYSNSTAIGFDAQINASNKVRIGNTAVTVIEGQVGFTAASDLRLKYNVAPLNDGLDFILKLKPVSYLMKKQEDPKLNWGFIAQDIESLLGTGNAILTIGGDEDRTLGLRYTDFIAPLVRSVQQQQELIAKLFTELESQAREIKDLRNRIDAGLDPKVLNE